jgi:hypothetical protein
VCWFSVVLVVVVAAVRRACRKPDTRGNTPEACLA